MDNLSAHKVAGIAQAIAAAGASILYLPAYSPDLNPIEQVFAKLKALLRKAAARTRDELWDVIGSLLDAFTPAECRNYLENAGYAFTYTQNALVAVVPGAPSSCRPAAGHRLASCMDEADRHAQLLPRHSLRGSPSTHRPSVVPSSGRHLPRATVAPKREYVRRSRLSWCNPPWCSVAAISGAKL